MKSNALLLVFISFMFFSVKSQIIEDFSSAKLSTTYCTGSFVGADGVVWSYVNARGGQSTAVNANAAISLNKAANACIFSDTLHLGITYLKFQWEQELTTNCNASVYINDSCIGKLISHSEADVTKYFIADSLAMSGPVVIKIMQNAPSSGQITIDDICFEYAQKPIVPLLLKTHEVYRDSCMFHYSNVLLSAQVYSIPAEALSGIRIENSLLYCYFNNAFCGNFQVMVCAVTDTSQQVVADTIIEYVKFAQPEYSSLVITEIMADPSPTVSLPDYEYIEIYNAGNCLLNLQDVLLCVGSKIIELPNFAIAPQQYVVITSSEAKHAYGDTVLVCAVKSFPAILNEGQSIALLNLERVPLTQLEFSTQWYGSSFKKNGGWSLEKKDVNNVSELAGNWAAAQNYKGGTPGYANSVQMSVPDKLAPYIETIVPLSDSIMYVRFSENLSHHQLLQGIEFSDGIIFEKVTSRNYSLREYLLHVSPCLTVGTEYYCYTNSFLHDMQGNAASNLSYTFALCDSLLLRNAIIISEILFNPIAGKQDFVELYNNSSSYYNLADIYIASVDSIKQDMKNFVPLSESYQIWAPGQLLVLSDDVEYYKQRSECASEALFVRHSSLPSFSDKEGSCVLLNSWGQVIDSLYYYDAWHTALIKKTEGLSLERLSAAMPTQSKTNWSTASTLSAGMTPGCANWQQNIEKDRLVSFSHTRISPDADELDDELTIYFNLPEVDYMISVHIFSMSGLFVTTIANNDIAGSKGSVKWNATCIDGRLVEPGIYIVLVEIHKAGKVIHQVKQTCTVVY